MDELFPNIWKDYQYCFIGPSTTGSGALTGTWDESTYFEWSVEDKATF